MCGIFGYIGDKNASSVIMKGLKRMEYRGYDSWGIATLQEIKNDKLQITNEGSSNKKINIEKKIGSISDDDIQTAHRPANSVYSSIGIGHTRWATHGGVSDVNAHPHLATDGSFALAQNGIVENYEELKAKLIKLGYKFISQTDTEVIVRFIEHKLKENSDRKLEAAVRLAFLELEGRNTIIVLDRNSNKVIGIRNGSPLVVGIGKQGENFISSDTLAFADLTSKVILIENYEMVVSGDLAEGKNHKLEFFSAKNGKKIDKQITVVENYDSAISKEGYEHFMIKEIIEQSDTIRQATNYSEAELKPLIQAIKKAKTVYTVGAGTAAYVASQIAYYLRAYSNQQAVELKSYETSSYKNLFDKADLIIAVSQSGETADSIEAIEFAKSRGAKVASIVNMMGSTISRLSDYKYYSRTGPEICVASTKAFTAQISWGYLLAKSIVGKYDEAKKEILQMSKFLNKFLKQETFEKIINLAELIEKQEHFFVLGKGQNYTIASEGALKVKEITYKHFEGFAAGELKHGVIALIDKGTPVFCIVSDDESKKDMMSASAEVKARGAYTVGIGDVAESDFFDYKIPFKVNPELSAVANVVPFQLLSYYLGVKLGNNVDKPRNLAKSVTVK
jgi:glucosamine--fructose-6-phosphate aminotransferase (isomerizing)